MRPRIRDVAHSQRPERVSSPSTLGSIVSCLATVAVAMLSPLTQNLYWLYKCCGLPPAGIFTWAILIPSTGTKFSSIAPSQNANCYSQYPLESSAPSPWSRIFIQTTHFALGCLPNSTMKDSLKKLKQLVTKKMAKRKRAKPRLGGRSIMHRRPKPAAPRVRCSGQTLTAPSQPGDKSYERRRSRRGG
jgi:hypothetical protein